MSKYTWEDCVSCCYWKGICCLPQEDRKESCPIEKQKKAGEQNG